MKRDIAMIMIVALALGIMIYTSYASKKIATENRIESLIWKEAFDSLVSLARQKNCQDINNLAIAAYAHAYANAKVARGTTKEAKEYLDEGYERGKKLRIITGK